MIEDNFGRIIEAVREKSDIVEIIGQHINLDRHNKALCPFHKETKPSFSVNPKGQYFHCFGCGAGGDVFRFLELYENKPFMEVLAELANQAGIPLTALTSEDRQRITEVRTIEDILTETAKVYHQSITPEVRDYLTKERGFTDETISCFQVGYANGKLREHLIDRCKFPLHLCLKAGVLKKVEGGGVRDYFYHRVIFPNIKRGRVVHLSGRSLDGQEPKYLHLPGELRYLFNEDDLPNKEVFIAEGIPDCISAVQAGYSTVAILGSFSFKPEYQSKFSRCETIYLCLDGDEAGKEGALKIGGLIGERARIIQLPEGVDLNDYLKEHSKEDFESLIRSAKDIIKYELNLIPPNTDKTQLPQRLEPILKKLARMEKVKSEAYLSYEIKHWFKLKKQDIDGYRDLVNEYRKGGEEAPTVQGANLGTNPVYTALLDGLVDLVGHHGTPAFLMKEGDKLSILPQVEKDGILYIPPPKEQIPWLLPRGEETLKYYELEEELSPKESDGALYNDLIVYFKAISELPTEEYYDLLTSWVLHTYFLEVVQYSPIICLFAVPERGKTRTGKGLVYLAYRGIHVESLRDAYLVRIANNFRSTIFFDVKDVWRKAEKTGSSDILLLRFEKGATVPRVLYPERGAFNDTVYYTIFGPTIVGTNESVHKILESRAITINMPESSRRFENDVTPELSLPLKERLIAFRARHLCQALPDMPKPVAGRLGDILKPLQQVIRLVRPDRETFFLNLVKELEAERLIDKADSLEGQILTVLIRLEDQVEGGTLPVKLIADTLNEDKSEKSQISYQRVGRRLSAMGFKKERAGNNMAILWDQKKIERMRDTYGLRETHETHKRNETRLDYT
ncbi:MAG: CHC2 zinc finger domain-containing protein [candidate division Zixibacteria bacterium]|nr:CHC2 zinc finger domain-containing protein [candidate division Zixibacteria bacterium]